MGITVLTMATPVRIMAEYTLMAEAITLVTTEDTISRAAASGTEDFTAEGADSTEVVEVMVAAVVGTAGSVAV
jgi:hypothetical protein